MGSTAVYAAVGATMPEASREAADGLELVSSSPCASLRSCRVVSALSVRSARTQPLGVPSSSSGGPPPLPHL
jgi:hypothetical protein